MALGFMESKADSNLYYKVEEGNPVILLLYVDDMFVTAEDGLITDTKRKLTVEFKMKNNMTNGVTSLMQNLPAMKK